MLRGAHGAPLRSTRFSADPHLEDALGLEPEPRADPCGPVFGSELRLDVGALGLVGHEASFARQLQVTNLQTHARIHGDVLRPIASHAQGAEIDSPLLTHDEPDRHAMRAPRLTTPSGDATGTGLLQRFELLLPMDHCPAAAVGFPVAPAPLAPVAPPSPPAVRAFMRSSCSARSASEALLVASIRDLRCGAAAAGAGTLFASGDAGCSAGAGAAACGSRRVA